LPTHAHAEKQTRNPMKSLYAILYVHLAKIISNAKSVALIVLVFIA